MRSHWLPCGEGVGGEREETGREGGWAEVGVGEDVREEIGVLREELGEGKKGGRGDEDRRGR